MNADDQYLFRAAEDEARGYEFYAAETWVLDPGIAKIMQDYYDGVRLGLHVPTRYYLPPSESNRGREG